MNRLRGQILVGLATAVFATVAVACTAPNHSSATTGTFVPSMVPDDVNCTISVPSPLPSPVASAFAVGRSLAKSKGVPGFAMALIYNGTTYQYYRGYARISSKRCISEKSIVELGSLTKTFTAALLAIAYNKNRIAPYANPGRWIDTLDTGNDVGAGCPAPVQPSPVPTSAYGVMKTMTLTMLATHTSGLPDTPPGLSLQERPCYSPNQLMNFVETYPSPLPAPTPPHPYLYSNIGYGTLGYVLQGLYKKPWFAIATSQLLSPLNMKHTYDVNDVPKTNYAQGYDCTGTQPVMRWPLNAWPSAGTLRSTLPDMTRYLSAAMQLAGTPQAIAAGMARAQTPVPGKFATGGGAQGMAWVTQTFGTITVSWKDGATNGFNSWIAVETASSGTPQTGIVVLANRAAVTPTEKTPACQPFLGSPADQIGKAVLQSLP